VTASGSIVTSRIRASSTFVVDAASIEVNRRRCRAKSDNLDAARLAGMLIRWHLGEKKLWGVVHVPTVADEDRRQGEDTPRGRGLPSSGGRPGPRSSSPPF